MSKTPDNSRDAVLARMLKTPPKPFTPKAKPKANPEPPKAWIQRIREDDE
jgi:hypothetical protein